MIDKKKLIAVGVLDGSGASGFSQANPETGTLYPASADGTFIWSVEQPSSPDYLDRLNGGFRVQDLNSNALGAVLNGWEWQLEYQTNGTWTFSWYSVTAGTKSAAIQTQTNIGSVVNVRVILDGNSLSVATSADGENYTSRGSTTSALYQAETGIAASYNGVDTLLALATMAANDEQTEANTTTGWGTSGGAVSSQSSEVIVGTYAIQITANLSGSFSLAHFLFTLTDDTNYIVHAQAKCNALAAANGARITERGLGVFTGLLTTSWQRFAWSFVPNEALRRVEVYSHLGVTGTTEIAYLDDLWIGERVALDASGDGGFSEVVST